MIVVASLAAAACGSGGDADEGTIAALTADLRAADGLDQIELTEAEARCTAEQVVSDLGPDRIEDAGFIGDDIGFDDLDEDEVEAVASALAGCGTAVEAHLAAAVEGGVLASSDESLPIDESEAECVSDAIVDALGVERLLVMGVGAGGTDPFARGELSDEEADAVADGFLTCVDVRQVFIERFRAEGVPEETATCIAAAIDDDDLRTLFAAEFTDADVDPDSLLSPAIESCGVR